MSVKTPKLAALAAVAEIVAALAVVVSLLYVGAEVRENTQAVRGATFQGLIQASDAYMLAIAGDESLADVVNRGYADPTKLTPTETTRFLMIGRVLWRNLENAFLQHQRGLLGETEWQAYKSVICSNKPTNPTVWHFHAANLSPEFVALVEAC